MKHENDLIGALAVRKLLHCAHAANCYHQDGDCCQSSYFCGGAVMIGTVLSDLGYDVDVKVCHDIHGMYVSSIRLCGKCYVPDEFQREWQA